MTHQSLLLHIIGYIFAFLTAAVVIAVDCDSTLKKAVGRAPINVWTSRPVLLLASACGVLAVGVFYLSDSYSLTGIVDFQSTNPPVRGIAVGIAILTIIRSKLLNYKDSEIGGEFFYNRFKKAVVTSMWDNWVSTKDRYTTDDLLIKACGTQGFEDRLIDALKERLKSDESATKWMQIQLDEVKKSRPAGSLDCPNSDWTRYFRILVKLALDCKGTSILSTFGFFPKA